MIIKANSTVEKLPGEKTGTGNFSQNGKVACPAPLEEEHFGWFELAGARIDRVTEYFEGSDS